MNNDVFSKAIEEALTDEYLKDISISKKHKFSKQFNKKMTNILNPKEKHSYKFTPMWRKRVICLVAVFILISTITVVSVEALREKIFNFFIDTFSTFSTIEYDTHDNNSPETLEYLYTITYDLSNYKIDYEYQDDIYRNITYVNNAMVIQFYQQTKDAYNINYNTEDAIIEEIVINDWNGIYFKDNHEYSNIILDVGDYIISISANLPKKQAIEIAKTIKKVE